MSVIGQGSVSIDDNNLLAQNAQETANSAKTIGDRANNLATNINSPSKLNPPEKVSLKNTLLKYDNDLTSYNIRDSAHTGDILTALTNLKIFLNPLLIDLTTVSEVDRDRLNTLKNAYAKAVSDFSVNEKLKFDTDINNANTAIEQGQKGTAAAIQLANDSFTKAQASIDGLNNELTKANQDIITASAQASKAYSSSSDALNRLVVLNSTVTQLGNNTAAQFNTLINGLQSKVSQTDFNNLKIGSRNYFLGSKLTNLNQWKMSGNWSIDSSTFNGSGVATITPTENWTSGDRNSINQNDLSLTEQDKVLISFWAKASKNDAKFHSEPWGGVGATNFSLTTSWQRYSYAGTIASVKTIYFMAVEMGVQYWFSQPQVEKGTMLTDYSIAPEDLAPMSSVTQLSTLIDQKVSNSTYQSDKVQTANQIASKVNSSDYNSFVSQTNNAIVSKVSQSDFNNLKVGGRNLVRNSGYPTDLSNWTSTGTVKIIKHAFYHNGQDNMFEIDSSTSNEILFSSKRFPVKRNTTYSIQFIGFAGSNVLSMDAWFLGRAYGSSKDFDINTLVIQSRKLSPNNAEHVTATFNTGNCDEGYIRFDNNGSTNGGLSVLLVTEIKVEEGNIATPWSPAPEDLATMTQFSQLNNALQLKANTADVTSQITVATDGIQQSVNSQVNGLQSQINQTSDTVQILSTTAGTKNLVYNSQFKISGNFPEGWNPSLSGYFTNHENSAYQGVGSIATNTTATSWTLFGQSKLMPLAVANNNNPSMNVYSASAMVLGYKDGDKPNGRVYVVLAFFDANGIRIESDIKGTWSPTADNNWHLVKVEGLVPVANAKYVAIQFFTQQNPTHAVVNQPMINVGTTVAPYRPDMVSQADITTSINNIHMGFQNPDGSKYMFNMSSDGTAVLDFKNIRLIGTTNIQDGTIGTAEIADAAINNAKIANASIDNAKITSIDAAKITTGIINTGRLDANSIIASVINGKTITGNVINGATINADKDGSITTSFGQVTQPASYYNPWSWDNGSISIGGGYVALKATGSAPTDGTKYGNYFLGTLSPSYLKFSEYTSPTSGTETSRIYIDALGITYRDTAGNPDVISIGGSHGSWFKTGAMFGANSYDYRGNIVIGATPHVINSQDGDSIVFEKGIGNKNDTITIIAANLAASSQLSKKKNISSLTPQQGYDWVKQTGISSYLYNTEQESHNYHISPIIDDINEQKQYGLAKSILTNDGSGIDINSAVFVGWLAIQQLQQLNENLQVRVRDLEMKLEGTNES